MNLTERILSRWTGTGVMVLFYVAGIEGETLDLTSHTAWLLLTRYRRSEAYYFKLLLRPNSDLTKEITHNGETFVPIVRLFEIYQKKHRKFNIYIGKTTFSINKTRALLHDVNSNILIEVEIKKFDNNTAWILNRLHEWHFACGLDESLWIDLNTVEVI